MHFAEWRAVPAPVRGAFVKRLGELLGEHKADVAELVTIEAGKITLGVPRRGAGGDRHLRLRGRVVAPARWAHDAVRAAGPPVDGDVAPARRGRRHHRIQLPVRGLGLERRGRLRLRRHHRLEALADDPSHLDGVLGPGGSRRVGVRRAGRGTAARDRRCRCRPGAGGQPRRRPRERDRIGAHGSGGRAPRRGPHGASPAGARREQRRDRGSFGRPRARPAGHRLRRCGNRRPAVHDPATGDRTRRGQRRAGRRAARRLQPPGDRRPERRRDAGRPADQREVVPGDGRGPGGGAGRRRRADRGRRPARGRGPPGCLLRGARDRAHARPRRSWCAARRSRRSST